MCEQSQSSNLPNYQSKSSNNPLFTTLSLMFLLLSYQSLDQTTREMDLLPEDILVQILVRLPVKCLLRFRCVSKAWCSLIMSPRFVDLHLSRAKSNDQENVILVKRLIKDQRKTVLSFHSHDESLSLRVVGPDFEVPFLTDYKMLLIGICNGIICLLNCDSDAIYLYNPATQEFLTLPDHPFGCPEGFLRQTRELGFGFDPTDDDYKIIKIITHPNEYYPEYFMYKAEIYSLNTNSWRELDANSPLRRLVYFPVYSVSFNGCFHWCKMSADPFGFKILSFDISTEQFREIQYPDGIVDPETGIGCQKLDVLDNLLALICYTDPQKQISDQHIDIWVMMEYGVQDSWIKKFSIGPLSGVQCPLSSWNNDKLLLEMSNGQLASCALLGDNQGCLTKYNVHGFPTSLEADIFQASLVSLGERCERRMH